MNVSNCTKWHGSGCDLRLANSCHTLPVVGESAQQLGRLFVERQCSSTQNVTPEHDLLQIGQTGRSSAHIGTGEEKSPRPFVLDRT